MSGGGISIAAPNADLDLTTGADLNETAAANIFRTATAGSITDSSPLGTASRLGATVTDTATLAYSCTAGTNVTLTATAGDVVAGAAGPARRAARQAALPARRIARLYARRSSLRALERVAFARARESFERRRRGRRACGQVDRRPRRRQGRPA